MKLVDASAKEATLQIPGYASRPAREKADWYSPSAKAYLQARPSYPPALVSAVAAVARLRPDSAMLEIGSGPGTATRDFCPLVGSILCVEPNVDFVTLARHELKACSNVSFVCDGFEDAELSGTFDAVLAATSFHWIDGETGVARIRSLLRGGGHIVLLWNKEPHPVSAQAPAIAEAFGRASFPLPAANEGRAKAVETLAALAAPLMERGFSELILCQTETPIRYDVETFMALHQSFSPFLALPEAERDRASDRLRRELSPFSAAGIEASYVSVGQVFRFS